METCDEKIIYGKNKTSNTNVFKKLKFFFQDKKASLLLTNSSKSNPKYIEDCIKSLFNIEITTNILGIRECAEDPLGEEILIPLDVLNNIDIFDEDKWYSPLCNYIPQSLPVNPQITQYQSSGFYGDPWQNDEYFGQYGKLTIHGEMIKDEARTRTYREAFKKLALDFNDKIVLDVGTGTSILAFFAVEAGAKLVYAVEASNLAKWSELIVQANGMANKISIIQSKIEDVVLPEKVDIIISEWMGTFLIFESMLESVLFARDNLLKENGLMLPSQANIFFAPVTNEKMYSEKVGFWTNVHDIDMSVLIPYAKKCAFEKPIIDQVVKPEQILAEPIKFKSFDLRTVPAKEPYEKTTINFSFKANKTERLHGFCSWFDVSFEGPSSQEITLLSTSPNHKDTHWHQQLFLFDDPVFVTEGQTISGKDVVF